LKPGGVVSCFAEDFVISKNVNSYKNVVQNRQKRRGKIYLPKQKCRKASKKQRYLKEHVKKIKEKI